MKQTERVMALGFFDGVHIGHAALIRRTLEICNNSALSPAVMTFDTLPQNVIGKKTIPLINSSEDRVGLIQRIFNIDDIVFLHFDKILASMPWDNFIDYLADRYNARHLVVGSSFRFGKGSKGDCFLLRQKCSERGLLCDVVDDVIYDGIISSSTYIRELLRGGNLERATTFLGHPHVLTDVVGVGKKLGRRLNAPTINMRFAPGVLVPPYGVYATKVFPGDDSEYIGVTNIGVRPTVGDISDEITVETHIPGFIGDLYGKNVRLEFYSRLRPEVKFKDTGELSEQIKKDCSAVMEYFNS